MEQHKTSLKLIVVPIMIALTLTSCSKSIKLTQYVAADDIKCSIYKDGRRIKVHKIPKNSPLWNSIWDWAKVVREAKASHTNFVPMCIIQGDRFQINFLKNHTIITLRNNKSWDQYVKPTTNDDKKIKGKIIQWSRSKKSHHLLEYIPTAP